MYYTSDIYLLWLNDLVNTHAVLLTYLSTPIYTISSSLAIATIAELLVELFISSNLHSPFSIAAAVMMVLAKHHHDVIAPTPFILVSHCKIAWVRLSKYFVTGMTISPMYPCPAK